MNRVFSRIILLGTVMMTVTAIESKAGVIGLDGRNAYDSDGYFATGSDMRMFRAAIIRAGHTIVPVHNFHPADLAGLDAVIVKQPYRSGFSSLELNSITDFVNRGAGLILFGDGGGGSSSKLINPLSSRFGITYSELPSDKDGFEVSEFVPHPVTEGLCVVGGDFQRRIAGISGGAVDLTAGSRGFLAVNGRAVFLSDSSVFSDHGAGSDYPVSFGDNQVLLENMVNYAAIPEPMSVSLMLLTFPLLLIRRHFFMGNKRKAGRLYFSLNKLLRLLYLNPAYRAPAKNKF